MNEEDFVRMCHSFQAQNLKRKMCVCANKTVHYIKKKNT